MYGSWHDSRLFESALALRYCFGLQHEGTEKNTAQSAVKFCTSVRNPRSDSSFSFRSLILTSTLNLISVWFSPRETHVGSPSTRPPPSTPRIAAHQPYLVNAFATHVANAKAALPHNSFLPPPVSSSYWNSSGRPGRAP